MKRIIATMLAISMVFSFSACNDAEKERYDALTEQISKLTEQIGALTGEITTLTSELESLKQSSGQSISDLEQKLQTQLDEMELMQKKIDNLTGDPIEFTEEAPMYGSRDSTKYTVQEFLGHHGSENIFFKDFENYLLNDFSQQYSNNLLYFNFPQDTGSLYASEAYRIYAKEILEDGTLVSPGVYQYFYYVSDVIGDNSIDYLNEIGYSGARRHSLLIQMYWGECEQDKNKLGECYLKFGEDKERDRNYANVYEYYREDGHKKVRCIGTVFYNERAYVSKTWFEKFIRENIRWCK
ncbi:MAG: hypothetical protein IJD07_00840 [Clostridia bacterium]|nr:hypothetical protein [Clostridia bacterium]